MTEVKTKYTVGEIRQLLSKVQFDIDGEKCLVDLTTMPPVGAMIYWCEMGQASALEVQSLLHDFMKSYQAALDDSNDRELSASLSNTVERIRGAIWTIDDLRETIDFSKPIVRVEKRPGIRGKIDQKLLQWKQDGWRLQIVIMWALWVLYISTEIAFNLPK